MECNVCDAEVIKLLVLNGRGMKKRIVELSGDGNGGDGDNIRKSAVTQARVGGGGGCDVR